MCINLSANRQIYYNVFIVCDSMKSTVYIFLIIITEWCKEYGADYIDPDTLQSHINTYMEDYDKKQQEVSVLKLF